MTRQRQLSLTLSCVGCLIPLLLLSTSPWKFSVIDFVLWPTFTLALPLFITGIISWLRSDQPYSLTLLLGLLIVLGIVIVGFACLWPTSGQSTTWEDSYEQLLVLDVLVLPVWVGTLVTTFWNRSMKNRVHPTNPFQR